MKEKMIISICMLVLLVGIFITEDKKKLKFFGILGIVTCIILMATGVVE